MTRSILALTVLVSTLATGCATYVAPTQADAMDAARSMLLTEGTPEALGVLALVNDPAVDFDVFDLDVGMDRRAAGSIVHYRDGFDGVAGTRDDNLFGSIDELDERYYVGDGALTALLTFAWDKGYVATGDDLLGIFDGVPFTAEEAELTVELANTAPEGVLDGTVGLDRRAVDSILAARQIETITQLADLYYVGGSAMMQLKRFATEL